MIVKEFLLDLGFQTNEIKVINKITDSVTKLELVNDFKLEFITSIIVLLKSEFSYHHMITKLIKTYQTSKDSFKEELNQVLEFNNPHYRMDDLILHTSNFFVQFYYHKKLKIALNLIYETLYNLHKLNCNYQVYIDLYLILLQEISKINLDQNDNLIYIKTIEILNNIINDINKYINN
jgi:hypothetical protein